MAIAARKLSALQHLVELQDAIFYTEKSKKDRFWQVEDGIHGEVVRFGTLAVAQAQAFSEQVQERRNTAIELKQALDAMAALPADGTLTDAQLAEWDAASNKVDRLSVLLENDAKNADWHLERLTNPLDAWNTMQQKYPPLRTTL
jgi:hypothetical protein